MEPKEINILVMAKGPSFELAYENLCQKLAKKYPNIHLYRIEPNTDYTKDLEKLKDITIIQIIIFLLGKKNSSKIFDFLYNFRIKSY